MRLCYADFTIRLLFEKDFVPEVYSGFLLRSVLGEQLHKLYCINKTETHCENCLFNSTCGYSILFETILHKDNDVVPGRIRGCHPFVIKEIKQSENSLEFSLVLLGDFIKYYSSIIEAFKRAGSIGFGNTRVRFTVETALEKIEPKHFELSPDCTSRIDVDYLITLKSPVRIVVKNKSVRNLSYFNFISAANRRMRQILMLYGEVSNDELSRKYHFSDIKLQNVNTEYINLKRWSSRQKRVEPLGGLTGMFNLKGNISIFEMDLLSGAEIFSVGKNTNFGLGNIECMERMEE